MLCSNSLAFFIKSFLPFQLLNDNLSSPPNSYDFVSNLIACKILEFGNENFEGGINTKKYISLTKVSKATAVRDIAGVLEYGCIKQIEGTGGRNVRYELNLPFRDARID